MLPVCSSLTPYADNDHVKSLHRLLPGHYELDLGVLQHLLCGCSSCFQKRGTEWGQYLCLLSFVFTLFFVSSRYGWEEMQRVDVFTSCVYRVYISWIMDSVSSHLLVIWKSKLGWGSRKHHYGVGYLGRKSLLGMLCPWVTVGLGTHMRMASLCRFRAWRITFLSLIFCPPQAKILTLPSSCHMLLGPAWKEAGKNAKILLHGLFFKWLSKV